MLRIKCCPAPLLLLFLGISAACFSQSANSLMPPGFKLAPDNRLAVQVMPGFNIDSVLSEDSVNLLYKDRPYRFGYNYYANDNLNNSGHWTNLPGGGRIWQLDVRCPGASSVNLAFSNVHIPEGAKLYVYSKGHDRVLGPYTSANNCADKLLGTEFIYDDEAVIEYYEPQGVAGQGTLTLFRITHGYKNVFSVAKAFGDAGNCEINVNCPAYSAWYNQKRAVVCLVSGGNEFCSGALVNNTTNDGTPYILTANHCGTADGTWIFRFNWEASGCTNPGSNPSSQSITGGTPVAQTAGSDFNLVLMNSVPPANYNVFYAGWTNSNTPATSVTGIHHPQGDIKKISQANNAVTASTYSGAQCWKIGQWTSGVTEPGSSGSPLFDQNQRIIGQLYGGPSYCGASAANLNDNYGRFSVSWNTGTTPQTRLHDWLDPNNTGAVTNDGYDPNLPTFSVDAGVLNITSPSGSTCSQQLAPVVVMRNAGSSSLTSVSFLYHVDGGTDSTYIWNGTLASLQTTNISLPGFSVPAGAHTFYVTIVDANGSADLDTANNNGNAAFTIISPNPLNLPFTETFASGTVPPSGWSLSNPDNDVTWTQSNTVGGFGQSTNSVYVDQSAPQTSTVGEVDDLITPFINLSGVSTPAYLSFDVANAKYNNTYYDSLIVLASSDCGVTWARLYAKGGNSLQTAPATTNRFVPTAAQWRRDTIHIDSYVGQPDVKFSFELKSGWGNVTYIDNVNITAAAMTSLDAAVNTITSPPATVCTASFTPSFNLYNSGQNDIDSVTIYYVIDNGAPAVYQWVGSLTTQQSAQVTLPQQTVGTGSHTFTVFTSLPNGLADGNTTNDTLSEIFTVGVPPVVSLNGAGTYCMYADTLDAGSTGISYMWSTGEVTQQIVPAATNTYSVTVTNAQNCTASSSVNVNINPLPIVSLSLPADTFCVGAGNVTLTGGTPSGGTFTGSNVSAGVFNVQSAAAGNYVVYYTYTDNNGCTASTQQNVIVQQCLGINYVTSGTWHAYPNPTTGAITIESPGSFSVEVYDVLGNIVVNTDTYSAHALINLSNRPNGIYVVKLTMGNNTNYFKVIKAGSGL